MATTRAGLNCGQVNRETKEQREEEGEKEEELWDGMSKRTWKQRSRDFVLFETNEQTDIRATHSPTEMSAGEATEQAGKLRKSVLS